MPSHSKKPSRTGGKRGGQGSDVLARQRALYALPLGEFMRARNALAAELKAQGQAKEAQATRQLRRPVIPAWVVNQLVHHAPEKLQRLQEAARTLEKGHRRALSGLGAEPLKEATRAFQQALDPLMAEASAILSAAGRASSVELLRQLEETLRAGTLGTEEERAPLAQGMLTQPLRQSGFGALSPLLLVGPSPEARARSKAREPKPEPRPTPPPAPPPPTPPAQEGVVLRGPWPTPPQPSKRQQQATRAEQKRAQRAAEQEQRRQAARQRAQEAKARRQREAELAQLRREAKQREQDAQARRKREAELTRLRREAKQRLAQAERAERGASLDLTREEATLRSAQAKTQRMREAFEQAQAAEQERAEAVAQARTQAEAAVQAVEEARSELQELDARLFR